MKKELRLENITKYSIELSKVLLSQFFIGTERITGEQLKSFCKIKQINLFLLKQLFDKWRKETDAIRSPYFNYNNAEVRDAMSQFMNVLSKHIEIRKSDFEALLVQAIEDSIILAIDPISHFEKEAHTLSIPSIHLATIKSRVKYYDFNRELIEKSIEEMHKSQKTDLLAGEWVKSIVTVMKEIRYNYHQEQALLDEFSNILSVKMDFLVKPAFIENPLESRNLQNKEEQTVHSEHLQETNGHQPSFQNTTPPKESSITQSVIQAAIHSSTQNNGTQKSSTLVVNRLEETKPLKRSISLNQKFMFINELFKGDKDMWDKACDEMEMCSNFEEAAHLLNARYAPTYNWDMNSEKILHLLEHVERRFAKKIA